MIADSIFEAILDATAAALQGAGIGIASANILVRALPKVAEGLDNLPAILITPAGEEAIVSDSFENSIRVIYPVEVAIVAASNKDMGVMFRSVLKWRQKIRRALHKPQLPMVETIYDANVKPNAVFDRSLLNQQYAFSSLLIQYHSHEPRSE